MNWDAIEYLAEWLDDNEPTVLTEQERILLRVLKVSEETGEASQAVIGAMGQNPRKGYTHEWEDVSDELCDVIVTAMVALVSIDGRRAPMRFKAHMIKVAERVRKLQAEVNGG